MNDLTANGCVVVDDLHELVRRKEISGANGMVAYDAKTNALYMYADGDWVELVDKT